MVRQYHKVRGYDEATGQVYEETQVPVTSMISAWPNKCRGARQRPSDYRHRGRGTSSLYDTAMRSCAWNINMFEPSVLELAGWHFSKLIYKHLEKSQTLTPNVWSMFQQAFPGEEELSRDYPIRIPASFGARAEYLPPVQKWLTMLPFSHLSLLNIQGVQVQLTDLIALTNLQSLGVLLLRQPHGGPPRSANDVDDRAMRVWGRAVQEKGAFKMLRLVGCYYCYASLVGTLKGLAAFPALRVCTVEPYTQLPSEQAATQLIRSANVPFQVYSGPESIWTQPDLSSHAKMKRLFDLAGDMPSVQPRPQQHPWEPILSVSYGSENDFSYYPYPIWFKRVGDVSSEHITAPLEKRPQDNGDCSSGGKGDTKKRKIRPGKQADIGSVLGAFG